MISYSEFQGSRSEEYKNTPNHLPSQLAYNILILNRDVNNKLWKSLLVFVSQSHFPISCPTQCNKQWILRETVNLYNLSLHCNSNPVTTLSLQFE
jgi:hypothetical protein